MSGEVVVVVPDEEPEAVPVVADDGGAGVAAGVALATAEQAEAVAEEALAVASTAVVEAADIAAETAVRCCEHCEEHGMRLASLEEGRGAELEAALVEEELDAPAPEPKPKKKAAPPAEGKPKRKPFWPV